MDKGRFSLLLLEPGEIYLEDFSAVLVSADTTVQTFEARKLDGRLKLCSKSLVFEPKSISKPLIKIPLKDCDIIEEYKGSKHFINSDNVFTVQCKQYIEMLERNIIAPYKFCEHGRFFIALNYANVANCLTQVWQLRRASTLQAVEQADMIATIVHSRHARTKFDPLWMDLYEKIELETQANKITPLVVNPGRVVLTGSRLFFQPYNNVESYPVIKINLNSIQRIFKRRFLLRHIGLEIYYLNKESHKEVHIYLSLLNADERDNLYDCMLAQSELKLTNNNQDLMMLQWQNGVISNYEYLLYINSLGDRSKNDLTQYPVFPWTILDFTSKTIDLKNRSIYRDLTKPVGALNETRLHKLIDRYEEMSEPKFIYGSHYSTPGFVLFYLVRIYPEYMLCLQNGRFDHPDRMFNSLVHLCKNSLNDMSDFKELIPEFYDVEQGGAFLVNSFGINFGYRHDDVKVNDVELPPWAESPQHFVNTMRDALESDYVSENLHSWIDLLFGYKQRGEEAIKAKNLYYHICYEGSVDLDSISNLNERHTFEVQIMEFGQIPKQIFKVPHPQRRKGSPLLIEPSLPDNMKREDVMDTWKNIKKLELKTTFSTHKGKVNCLLISDDCDKIVSVGYDEKLKLFSLELNRQIRSASIGNMPLSCCIKMPDNNMYMIGNLDNERLIYNMDYGRVLNTATTHHDAITCLAYMPKLNMLFSGSDDCTVSVWSWPKDEDTSKPFGHLLYKFDHTSHVKCMSFDSVNDKLAVGTEDGEIFIWHLTSDFSLNSQFSIHSKRITAISYSSDGQKLVTCSLDKCFQVTDINTGMSLYKKELQNPLTCLKWDTILLIGSQDGILYIWDMIEVKLLHEIQAHKGAILTLDISKDKKYVATGGEDRLIKVWNPT